MRRKIAETPSPTGEPITISLGITTFKDDQNPQEVIMRADTAPYQSKHEG
ncbi:diguanylate cyclase domain-containing protein [Ureibacillus acetophenoni]